MELILASGSPRRKQLLESRQYQFRTDPIKLSEIIKENLSSRELLMDLARQKAKAYLKVRNPLKSKDFLLLTGDTMVIFNDQPLGKPQNESEAAHFLNILSGKKHFVMTGICLFHNKSQTWVEDVESTEIEFFDLSKTQIDKYVASGEPMDKAGAYGIQGEAKKFVKNIEGSWSNVVGLPMELLDRKLSEHGWNIDQK